MLNKFSTKVTPNIKYKTEGKDLDGSRLDVQALIGKIPKSEIRMDTK